MGHFLFILLHLAALVLFAWALFLTVPLHILFVAVRKPSAEKPFIPGPGDIKNGYVPEVHCPDCRELVRADARKCKHCGTALTPPTQQSS